MQQGDMTTRRHEEGQNEERDERGVRRGEEEVQDYEETMPGGGNGDYDDYGDDHGDNGGGEAQYGEGEQEAQREEEPYFVHNGGFSHI